MHFTWGTCHQVPPESGLRSGPTAGAQPATAAGTSVPGAVLSARTALTLLAQRGQLDELLTELVCLLGRQLHAGVVVVAQVHGRLGSPSSMSRSRSRLTEAAPPPLRGR